MRSSTSKPRTGSCSTNCGASIVDSTACSDEQAIKATADPIGRVAMFAFRKSSRSGTDTGRSDHLSYFKRTRVGTVGTVQITPPLPEKCTGPLRGPVLFLLWAVLNLRGSRFTRSRSDVMRRDQRQEQLSHEVARGNPAPATKKTESPALCRTVSCQLLAVFSRLNVRFTPESGHSANIGAKVR